MTIAQEDLMQQTIADFGAQWTQFTENRGYYASPSLLADVFGPLFSLDGLAGRRVVEIGSGTGRIVNMLLDAGAEQVIAVEPSAAFDVLRRNTQVRQDRIVYMKQPGHKLPATLAADLVVAIGVLHHIPDPRPAMATAYQALKPGGHMIVWLYGHEGNETYLRFVDALRSVTTRLPDRALRAFCHVLNALLDAYILACAVLPLPLHRYMRKVIGKFTRPTRFLVIFDQLNPAYAKYYKGEEAVSLVADAGFVDVRRHHRHGYSWTVIGRKPAR
jgi:SAM-dependent methyltransferase